MRQYLPVHSCASVSFRLIVRGPISHPESIRLADRSARASAISCPFQFDSRFFFSFFYIHFYRRKLGVRQIRISFLRTPYMFVPYSVELLIPGPCHSIFFFVSFLNLKFSGRCTSKQPFCNFTSALWSKRILRATSWNPGQTGLGSEQIADGDHGTHALGLSRASTRLLLLVPSTILRRFEAMQRCRCQKLKRSMIAFRYYAFSFLLPHPSNRATLL